MNIGSSLLAVGRSLKIISVLPGAPDQVPVDLEGAVVLVRGVEVLGGGLSPAGHLAVCNGNYDVLEGEHKMQNIETDLSSCRTWYSC